MSTHQPAMQGTKAEKWAPSVATLSSPLQWRNRRTVWMSDLFHEAVPAAFIDRVFSVMALCPQHTFIVLTKRPERMRAYLSSHDIGLRWLLRVYRDHDGSAVDDEAYQESDAVRWTRTGLDNVILGVSVENQSTADERIPLLLQTPAAVRFVSAEPLLGPIDLRKYLGAACQVCQHQRGSIALDDEIRHQHSQECDTVAVAADLPDAHPFPSTTGAGAVDAAPSHRASKGPFQPLHNGSRGAVNGDASAVRSLCSPTPVEVAFPVEKSGDVAKDSGVFGNSDGASRESGTRSTSGYAKEAQPSLDGGAARAEARRESGDSGPIGVARDQSLLCNCNSLHTPHYITWVLAGGESGPKTRPCDVAWVRSIVGQCRGANVPCFVKQLGAVICDRTTEEWPNHHRIVSPMWAYSDGLVRRATISRNGADPDEWPADLRVREWPEARR